MANPFLGVLLHATGGFAAGSFYLPIKKIKAWSWESAWLTNGIFAWIVAPLAVSLITVPETWSVLQQAPTQSLLNTFLFGLLWGIGGLTFGLALRYLGISLGMALALGLTAAFGTLIPPLYDGEFGALMQTTSGQLVLLGVGVCLLGIAICGRAGWLRDKNREKSKIAEGIKDSNLVKGVVVAFFAGIMSSCFAFGMIAGQPIASLSVQYDTPSLWQNGPVFIIILWGGFCANFIWCAFLNVKNKTYTNYADTQTPLRKNYLFAAVAGVTWYCQFMFYGMGSTQMGEHDFASWTLHMAFIIVFSTFWGLVTKEWKGSGKQIKYTLAAGLSVLILSTIIIGLSNQIATV
ncbi:L-rhamnose/proton symporter RhaT [Croceiramulus getboli]|nr:L-rhamnose/proton symporter RhaT [Flavobacteriaceae bacterium YJPT1-3]